MNRYSFSSNEPIRVYNSLSGALYNPQRTAREDTQTDFHFIRRSCSGLTGEIAVNGPGVKIVPFLDRFHPVREDHRAEVTVAAIDAFDEEVVVSITRKGGGDFVIELLDGGKEKSMYKLPLNYYIPEEDRHATILSNIGKYATMTVLLNVMAPTDFRPIPENIDEFSFRAERSFTSIETGRHYLIARRPGMIGLRENYVVGLEVDEKERERRVKSSWFRFEHVQYQFHPAKFDDGTSGYAISALRKGIMSDASVVHHTAFEEGTYEFREVLRKMARDIDSVIEKEDE